MQDIALTPVEISKRSPAQILGLLVKDPDHAWSMGSFGALGEFARVGCESAETSCSAVELRVRTKLGALQLNLPKNLRLFAYEIPIGSDNAWIHGIALCLPVAQATLHRRNVITEIGPDRLAYSPMNRDGILFDMGLQCPQADFYVRSCAAEVVEILRSYRGQNLLGNARPLLKKMPELSPHRVIASRLGRLEVYQPIPRQSEPTPQGPHTHVLPELARLQRAHNANVPIPNGWLACATLHFAHPCQDIAGQHQPFQKDKYQQFQALLARFGDPDLYRFKRSVTLAARDSQALMKVKAQATSRFSRAVLRVTLRQLQSCHQ